MQCRLLFNEEPITINRLAANVLGLNEAIVVQQIHYWLNINEKAKINIYDGKVWTFNTYKNWQKENFTFWSVSTLKRIFSKLEENGILIKGNYNKKKYDQTLWVTLDYDVLEKLLVDYENENNADDNNKNTENVEISTECQNDTMSDCNRVSKWNSGECQVDTMESVKMTLPIPKTTKEITKEIISTTHQDAVVETNKEIIESNTHLILDSNNKKIKVSKWNKDRLLKAIDIFKSQEGVYFSLLEKIYKDAKNFADYSTVDNTVNCNTRKLKTRFHNITDRTKDYTPEALEKLLKENQVAKYAKEKEKEEIEANEEKNVTVEVTKELVNECISNVSYFNSLDQNTKYSVRDYVSNKGGFMPLHIRNI